MAKGSGAVPVSERPPVVSADGARLKAKMVGSGRTFRAGLVDAVYSDLDEVHETFLGTASGILTLRQELKV